MTGEWKRGWSNYRRRRQIYQRFPSVTIEPGVLFKGALDNLRLGKHVVLQSGSVLHLGGTTWCLNQGRIEIGDGSVISPNCVIYGGGPGGVHIGKDFDCGPNVGIFASRTDYERGPNHHIFKPVVIGDSVIVFAHAVISPGVTIGDRAVIAAGSVVLHDVAPYTLVAGVPARVIRKIG